MKQLEITWRDGPATGYTDILPLDLFAKSVSGAAGLHAVVGPRGGVYHARFRVVVEGQRAELDYSQSGAFNNRNGILPGTMVVHFTDARRLDVASLSWDGEDLADSVRWIVRDSQQSADVRAPRVGGMRMSTDRPEQSQFRRDVEHAYGGYCSISGCDAPGALEAAHIRPFDPLQADVASNGLLLRADLHALFDCNQLAIHPTDRTVHFAPDALGWAEYAEWHSRRILSNPQSSFAAARPSDSALQSRWDAFREAYPPSGRPRRAV